MTTHNVLSSTMTVICVLCQPTTAVGDGPPGNGTFLRFDGASGRVATGQWASPVQHTIEAWVRPRPGPPNSLGRTIAGHVSALQCGRGYQMRYADSGSLTYNLDLQQCGGSGYYLSQRITNETWWHVAGTFDGTYIRLFVNGALVREQENCVDCRNYGGSCGCWDASHTANWFQIGAMRYSPSGSGYDVFFSGDIDEVRLWNYARSGEEIVSFKDVQLNGDEAGLIGYWTLDEGQGSIAHDVSGGSHNGTLAGGVTWQADPAIEIGEVTCSDSGVLDFGELPYCSADTIYLVANTTNAGSLTTDWLFEPDDSSVTLMPVFDGGPQASITVAPPGWNDALRPRDTLMGFTVTARLVDGDVERARSAPLHIPQSDLGKLRQEYVDHDLHPQDGQPLVPPVSSFREWPANSRYNSQREFAWAILDPWALQAIGRIVDTATSLSVRSLDATSVTSIYRSPCRHWQVYDEINEDRRKKGLAEIPVTTGSRHMWGIAVDFSVGNFGGLSALENYNILANICRFLGYRVFVEGDTRHVHIQLYGGDSASVIVIRPPTAASYAPVPDGVVLTVNGAGFVPSSVVRWNGEAVHTEVNSAIQLTARLTALQFATAPRSSITVSNPGEYGGTSNSVPALPGPPRP